MYGSAFVGAGALGVRGHAAARRDCGVVRMTAQPEAQSVAAAAVAEAVAAAATTTTTTTTTPVTRRAMMRGFALAAAAAAVGTGAAQHARAEGGLGDAFSSTLFPKEQLSKIDRASVVMDTDILKDPKVQAGLNELREYRSKLTALRTEFNSNPQMDIIESFKKTFSVSQLRDDLNKVNSVLDEETQLKTDRIVRGIIQDLGEIYAAAKTKADAPRTPKKIEKTNSWLDKLTNDFDKLLSFY